MNIRAFFDWLGVSKSGYDWLIQHRLANVKDLIAEHDLDGEMLLPNYIADTMSSIAKPTEKFIPFAREYSYEYSSVIYCIL